MLDHSRVETAGRLPRGDVGRGGPIRGAGDVSAILPNGRVIWLRMDQSPAPASALDWLEQDVRYRLLRRRASARRQAFAIRLLAGTTGLVAESVTEERLARSRRLRRRLIRSRRRLDERITKTAEKARRQLERQLHIERETLRRIHRRDIWDK